MAYQLNAGQRAASVAVTEFIRTPIDQKLEPHEGGRFFIVKGAGGTGKTTTIFDALLPFVSEGKRVLLVAPTNKAAKVLRRAASEWGLKLDCMTMASALGVAMLPDEERKYAAQVAPPKIGRYHIVIADEGSMYSNLTLKLLIRSLGKTHTKVVILGDDLQIPPVGENECKAFALGKAVELVEVERFKGTVQTLSENLRSSIINSTLPSEIHHKPDPVRGGVNVSLGGRFITDLLAHINPDTTPDDLRVIAWTNARVDELNCLIREHQHGKRVKQFLVGERVVTTDAVKGLDTEIILGTDEECVIERVHDDKLIDPFDSSLSYRVFTLVVKPIHIDRDAVVLHIIKNEDEDALLKRKKWLAAKARKENSWAEFWAFSDAFHSVKHCFAITAHRAQGSTFKTVFVDAVNISNNKKLNERLRLLYVACSRPSRDLFINRTKFLR